jgi:branched-subunit amino acid permease
LLVLLLLVPVLVLLVPVLLVLVPVLVLVLQSIQNANEIDNTNQLQTFLLVHSFIQSLYSPIKTQRLPLNRSTRPWPLVPIPTDTSTRIRTAARTQHKITGSRR